LVYYEILIISNKYIEIKERMPYNNAYNQSIASQLQSLYSQNIAYHNATDDNVRQNDVMSPLEGMALREENVHGGSGTAAATLHDLGYEQMNGISGSGEPVIKKRTYKRKPKPEVVHLPTADANPNVSVAAAGVSGGGVSAGGVSGGGVSAGGISGGGTDDRAIGGAVEKKKRAPRKRKEAPVVEPVVDSAPAADPPAAAEGGAKPKRINTRAAIVGKIMEEKGMKMAEASKYVKEHGLYKTGGALMTLASLDNMKGNQGPTPFTSGGVPNTKLVPTTYAPPITAGRKPRAKKAG
jgi:hypothetical protein